MMMAGPTSIFLFLLLSVSPADELPSDALALVEPGVGLELLGENSREANLARLIDIEKRVTRPAEGKLSRELESAIQNLASSSEKVRESSRKKLIGAGLVVKKRLEEVVAGDAGRAKEAKKILQALADAQSASGQERDIARIFAIRLAAEKKLTALVPVIERAVTSENWFVRFAAKDALARLAAKKDGGAKTIVSAPASSLLDVRALPASANVLAAMEISPPVPGKVSGLTLGGLFKAMTLQVPGGAPADMENDLKQARTALIGFVKTYGNMRPERVVFSNFGDIGPTGGGLGIVVHGRYQPDVLRASLEANSSTWKTTEVSGSTVYNSAFLRIVLLSESSVLILPLMASNKFPLAKFLENYNKKTDAISKSERLTLFVETLERPFHARALVLTGESLMKQIWAELDGAPEHIASGVKGMKELELTLAKEKGDASIRLEGQFDNKQNAKAISDIVDGGVKELIAELEQYAGQVDLPMFKTMLTALKTTKVTADGKRGIFRMQVPAASIKDFMSSFLMVGGTAPAE